MKEKFRVLNEKVYFILLLSIAFLTPTAEALPIKLASFSVILLAVHWIVSGDYRQKYKQFINSKLLWLFLALFLINLPGLLQVENLGEANKLFVRKLPLLLFPLVIGTSVPLSSRQVNYIILSFVIGLFGVSLFTFREGITVLLDRQNLTTMVELTALHRPYAGMFSVFAIIGLIRLSGAYTSILFRMLIGLAILYFLFFIYILYVKMTVIVLALLAVIYIVIGAVKKFGKYPVAAISLVVLLAGFWYLAKNEQAKEVYSKISKFEDFSYQEYNIHLVSSINIRFINWGCSVEVLKQDQNWLTGLGIGDAQGKLNMCYKDLNPWIYESQMNAHNEYLQETLRNGIVGLAILLLCLAIPLWLSIHYGSYTYIGFIVLVALSCITENVFSRQAGIMFYALFNAIFAFSLISFYIEASNSSSKEKALV